MPKPLRLSHTSLDTYQKCGYKYFLKYKQYIKPYIPIRWPLVNGVAFHNLADLMYKSLNFDCKFLISNWKPTFIEALDNESCTFQPITGWDKQLKYGYGLVYQFHKFALAQGYLVPPMHSEWPFTVKLDHFSVTGKVDLIMPKKGAPTEILDFKTSWKLPSKEAVKKNKQLTIYDWAVKKVLGLKNVKSGLFFPRKNAIMYTDRTEADHNEILCEFENMAKNITNEVFEPSYDHCKWCDFKNYCKYYKKEGSD